MKFAVSGIGDHKVKDAKLRLSGADGSSSGMSLCPVTSRWEQSHVTWRSAPAVARTSRALRTHAVRTGRSAQFDVSRIVTEDGVCSVRISSRARNGVAFNSRDAAQHRPRLVVTLAG